MKLKIFITLLIGLFFCSTSAIESNEIVKFIYSKDKFTKKISKKLKIYIIDEFGYENELMRMCDSSNVIKYTVPHLSDSFLTAIMS